jgi:UDP-N-acetylmuramoyl-tripeptide--D-alanyl-D-alanine ligase
MTTEDLHKLFLKNPFPCTDTRNIKPNCIFFALKGDNFNGNSFAQEALQKGASYAVVDEPEFAVGENILLVDSALESLQDLASCHRSYSSAKIIALTGSNGKTTTKELIHAVLSKKYRTIATKGNLNNHIGVPLTLLSIKEDTEFTIVEMGANHLKEISFLADIARPDFGYITNFGKAHLEGFGSKEGVIRGKSELYDYLQSSDKYIFLNGDDPIQEEKLNSYHKKVGFSSHNHRYYIIKFNGAHPFVSMEMEGIKIDTQLIGGYNFANCSAAALMGKYFNIPVGEIKDALENYIPGNNRSQLLEKNNHRIILDAYKDNTTSMTAAI